MNDCLRNSTLLSWVVGNGVLLLARVYEKVLDEGEVTDLPFDLSACDDIAVTATNGYKTEVLEWAIAQDESNCLALHIPHTLSASEWALEITCKRNGYHVRSFEFTFRIVETNCEAQTTFEVVDGCQSASVRVTLQVVPQATVRGKNAYELWKELPGNEDKTLQDYIDEVLDMNGITAAAREATDAANTAADSAASTEADVKTAEAARVTAEAGRVSNENTRIVNEEAREGREAVREDNESGRVRSETTRVQSEFDRVRAERERMASETNREEAEVQRESDCAAAVRAANAASANANDKAALADSKATLAGEKAALADEKAGLADTKAALANTAATNANTKAALANEKAILAKTAAANADAKAALADEKAALADEKATEAGRVNAQLTTGGGAVMLTVTNRQGVSNTKEVGFRIFKTYDTVAAMNADAANVDEGRFVMIAGDVEQPDTGKLYVKGASGFTYITDLSGAQGIKGDAFTYADFTEEEITELQRPATVAAAAANTAATNANEKAALANTKAQAADTAAQNAQTKAAMADRKATEAGRVNATVSGTVLTVTDRNGVSTSVDTKGEKGNDVAFEMTNGHLIVVSDTYELNRFAIDNKHLIITM